MQADVSDHMCLVSRCGMAGGETYSGWRLNETSGPSGLGFVFLGSMLARVTALGSNEAAGKRSSSLWTAWYMKGAWEAPIAAALLVGLVFVGVVSCSFPPVFSPSFLLFV